MVLLVNDDDGAALFREPGAIAIQRHHPHTGLGPAGQDAHHPRQSAVLAGAVDHQHHLVLHGGAARACHGHGVDPRGNLAQPLAAGVLGVADAGRHAGAAGVRKPLDPLPLRGVVVVAHHDQLEVARRAQRRERSHHDAGGVEHAVWGARHTDRPLAQVNLHRGWAHANIAFVDAIALGSALVVHAEVHLADANTDAPGIRIIQTALPQPGEGAQGDVAQVQRVG